MNLNRKKTTFGRHESFALRYGWLTKGYNAYVDGVSFGDDATVELGVGRNMVNAIKYWLKASQVVGADDQLTALGHTIFHLETGYDPYLEDEATIWLLHWLLASNPDQSTGIYWFFNKFHKREFSSEEVQTALVDFSKEYLGGKTSPTTIKSDAQLILKMYTTPKLKVKRSIEDLLDSPLSLLRLITKSADDSSFVSKPESRSQLPIGIFGFAISQYLAELDQKTIPLEDLMYAKDDRVAPGAIFRLSENDLLTKLENVVKIMPGKFQIRETAGISQLYVIGDELDPNAFLSLHYQPLNKSPLNKENEEKAA